MECFFTQISVVRVTELPPTSEAEVERQLVCLSQLHAIIDGRKCVLCVVERHKAVVVAVDADHGSY